MSARIPVTLLTGFLGAGKSTLLGRLLRDPRFSDTAVVVNEFGEVGLDGALVAHEPEQIVEMTTGCLCCTIRGDVRETLLRLHARAAAGESPTFSRLVIETTGLADPAPVIHTLMQDPRLLRRYLFAGVVTVVDAVTAESALDRQPEAVKQAAVADRLVLTKTDLARDPVSRRDVARLTERLRALNPAAPILDRNAEDFDLRAAFDLEAFDPLAKSMDVRGWLAAEAYAAEGEHDHRHHDGHRHHHHDVNRHGPDIRAFSISIDDPVPTGAFTTALEALIATQGENLLRVKGIVCLKEKPDTPVAIHGVQHLFHDPMILDAWPDADRRTRLVFITRGVPKAALEQFFAAWLRAEDGAALAGLDSA